MLIRKIQPEFCFEDDRGKIVQLISRGYAQVNVLFSKAGTVRGNHYHKRCTEAFYVVSGSVTVGVLNGKICEETTFLQGDFFQIQPKLVHSLHFEEDCTLVQLYDTPVENSDGTKDFFKCDEANLTSEQFVYLI